MAEEIIANNDANEVNSAVTEVLDEDTNHIDDVVLEESTDSLFNEITIYEDDELKIIQGDNDFKLDILRDGYTFDKFKTLMEDYPQISLIDVANIKKNIHKATELPIIIGVLQPKFEVETSPDKLEAYVTIYNKKSEFASRESLEKLRLEVKEELQDYFVTHGLLLENITFESKPQEKILIAKGYDSIDGVDSIIKMYEVKPPVPEILENGDVNYYNIHLIHPINKGDWLGEMLDATPGTPGKTIEGVTIIPKAGKQLKLDFDKKSVMEVYDAEKKTTTLHSLKQGAIFYDRNTIQVRDCFNIEKNLDYGTGNVHFNGFVNIKGTVDDNFELTASKDIQIMSDLGVGKVNLIESHEGSISIQGGVAGKDQAIIKAKKDVFVKYADHATIECEGVLHVGFYLNNCTVKAREVIVAGKRARIIGGKTEADIRVTADEIGNNTAILTYIKVHGFDNQQCKYKLEDITNSITEQEARMENLKNSLSTEQEKQKLNDIKEEINIVKGLLKELKDDEKSYMSYLKDFGEGSIVARKKIHCNSYLEIKELLKIYSDDVSASTTLYYEDEDLHEG